MSNFKSDVFFWNNTKRLEMSKCSILQYCSVEILQTLLAHSVVEINALDWSGNTVLMWTTYRGCEELTIMLLETPGIEINFKAHYNRSCVVKFRI